MFKLLILMAATAVAVTASGNATIASNETSATATSTSAPGLSACVIACIKPAAIMDGCFSYGNVSCVCTSAQFQADSRACLKEYCPNEVESVLKLQTKECSAAGLSVTGPSVTPRPVSFTSPAATGTASGAATSGTLSRTTTATATSSTSIPATSNNATRTATPTASTAAGYSLVANCDVAVVVAMIAGFLAL